MESWKEYHRRSKYGSSKFKSSAPYLVGIMSVKEFHYIIDIFAIIISVIAFWTIPGGAVNVIYIGMCTHLLLTFTFSTASTLLERKWRRKNKIQDEFRKTLNRLSLNSKRKYYDRKTSF